MKRVFAHIGFSFALTMVVLNLVSIKWAFVILGVTSAVFVVTMLIKKTRRAVAIPLCMASCMLAVMIFVANYYGNYSLQCNLDSTTVEAEFYIVDIEDKGENSYKYTVKTASIDADDVETVPQNIKIVLYSSTQLQADYYETMRGQMSLSLVAENAYQSYGKYADGIFLSAYLYDYTVDGEIINSPNRYVLEIKEALINYFLQNLDGDSAGIAIALATGNKSYISDETMDMFSTCGVSHIMAVSGLHLTIFVGLIYYLLKRIKCPKIPSLVITILFTLGYMTLIGFTPSIIRAGIMSIILYLSKFNDMENNVDPLNSLGFATFVICLNPYAITSLGAMLTIAAMLGIETIYTRIMPKKRIKNNILRYVWLSVLVSVSVFITTFPILYLFFDSVGIVFVFLNLILVPLTQVILVTILICLGFFAVFFLKVGAFFVLDLEANLMLFILEKFSALSIFVLDVDSIMIGVAIGAVFIFMGIAVLVNNKLMRVASILSVIIFGVTTILSTALSLNNTYVRLISGDNNSTAIFVYDSEHAFIAGVEEYEQYSQISSILKAKGLEVYMVIDTDGSDYSRQIAENFDVVNYVANYSYTYYDIYADNVLATTYFDVELWQGLNVEYDYYDGLATAYLTVDGFSIVYTNATVDTATTDLAIFSDAGLDNDIVYTFNDNGYIERRVNDWQK